MSRLVVLALGGLAAAAAASQAHAVCPLAALAPPRMESVEQYVVVGQPRPCPPPNRTRHDFAVTTDFGDGVSADTPYRDGDPL